MDLNHDGKLSATEFKGPEPRFARLDANHDGFITRAEAAKASQDHVHHAMVVARYKSMDKNKDGKLTPEEFTGTIAEFLKLDKNKDGVITKGDVNRVITTAIAAKAKAKSSNPCTCPCRQTRDHSAASSRRRACSCRYRHRHLLSRGEADRPASGPPHRARPVPTDSVCRTRHRQGRESEQVPIR